MTVQAKAGSFLGSSGWALSSAQDVVTGLAFTPQLALFFDLGTSLDATAADLNVVFGMSDGTTNVCVVCHGRDAVTTASGAQAIRSDNCYYRYTASAGARGAFTCAMIAGGIRLTVTDLFDSGSRQIGYLLLGGLTGVKVGASAFPAGTGPVDVTGLGFQPSTLIAAMGYSTRAINTADDFTSVLGLGVASGATQAGLALTMDDAAAGENSLSRWNESAILASLNTTGSMALEASLSAFLADGFRLNKLSGAGTGAFIWAAFAGSAALSLEAARTSLGSVVRTGLGFQPAALLAFSTMRATASQALPSDSAKLCLGVATGAAERVALCTLAPDALATTDSAEVNRTTALLTNVDRTGADTFAVTGELDLTSLDSDGYTLDQQDADTAASRFAVLAIGNLSATPNDPAQSTASVPASHLVGSVRTVTVQARKSDGSTMTVGGATVVVTVTGANPATPTVTDHADGTYTCTQTPSTLGADSVAVTMGGVAISGSPYASTVVAGGAGGGFGVGFGAGVFSE